MSEMNVDDGSGRQRSVRVNYPSNSKMPRKDAPEKEHIEKITTGEVVQRKKPWYSRLGPVNEDAQSVGHYILFEVMVPAAKNMVSDAVSEGIQRLLFGESRRGSGQRPGGYTSYNRVRQGPNSPTGNREMSRRARATHDFDDIVLSSRGEAEEVIDRLMNLVDKYEQATVADLYDLVGITGSFTDDKWGWYDLRDAGVRPIRGGYLVVLPKTQPLD